MTAVPGRDPAQTKSAGRLRAVARPEQRDPPWGDNDAVARNAARGRALASAGVDVEGKTAPTLGQLDAASPDSKDPWALPPATDEARGEPSEFGLARDTPPERARRGSLGADLSAPKSDHHGDLSAADESADFWDAPGSEEAEVVTPPAADLSSDGFDSSTGWRDEPSDVDTVDYLWGVQQPDAPDPAKRSEASEAIALYSMSSIPAIPDTLAGLDPKDAVKEAQRLFKEGHAAEGMALLETAAEGSPGNDLIDTWLDFGERRLIAKYCPKVRANSIPTLTKPREELVGVTQGPQRALVAAIDGSRSVAEIREMLPGLKVVGFWKDLGKLSERGWVNWREPSG